MTFLEKMDKANLKKILLVVISVLTLAALALLLVIIVMSIAPKAPELDDGIKDLKNYTVTEKDMVTGSLLVVNTNNKYEIPSDEDLALKSLKEYRTENTEGSEIPYSVSGDLFLTNVAAEQVHAMIMKLIEEKNVYDLPVTSGFRSLNAQTEIKGVAPGYSDHHTGMLFTFDFDPKGDETAADKDAKIQWITENAYKYGIVQRYPADKADKTGIDDYTAAYRYVGEVHASYMNSSALCLEEYIAYLKENTGYEKALTLTVNGVEYSVYYVSCSAGDTIKVPESGDYTISGTNEGGVVITAKNSK